MAGSIDLFELPVNWKYVEILLQHTVALALRIVVKY